MKVLVIGSGGREHALAWRLAQSPAVSRVYASPGNAGMAQVAELIPASNPAEYLAAAEAVNADLTVVGPEAPLVAGIVDQFRAAGRRVVGPTADAARLEGSKIYAKEFFRRHRIPTAEYVATETPDEAQRALRNFRYPVVIKADGLAAGKGVIIAHDRAEAERAIQTLGGGLVIEEFLVGEEVTFIALTDGRDILPLAPTQDHKAVFDGDQGPNTGGMGAYCEDRILTPKQTDFILERIIHPAVSATSFSGFLYAGLMITAEGPKVLEFNVRLGDPETQPMMHRLDVDLAPVLMAAATGDLSNCQLRWKTGASVCVVMASGGYPDKYETGALIEGIAEAESTGATVFHAGTRRGAAGFETAGGRVLGVTASGHDLPDAIRKTYTAVEKIRFEGMHFRRDIGRKGLKRYNQGIAEGT